MLDLIAAAYNGIAAPDDDSIMNVIPKIIEYLMYGVGIVAVIIIIYSAFLIITAGGEPEKFKNGRQALTAGIIGLIIAVLGSVIVQIIMTSIGVYGE